MQKKKKIIKGKKNRNKLKIFRKKTGPIWNPITRIFMKVKQPREKKLLKNKLQRMNDLERGKWKKADFEVL